MIHTPDSSDSGDRAPRVAPRTTSRYGKQRALAPTPAGGTAPHQLEATERGFISMASGGRRRAVMEQCDD